MNYLADSNILIWFFENNSKLPAKFREILLDSRNSIFISIASLWEISLKYGIQKLKLPVPLSVFIDEIENRYDFSILPVKAAHILFQTDLPFHHRDPFDRLIYAQSVIENLEFLYTDSIFDQYRNRS